MQERCFIAVDLEEYRHQFEKVEVPKTPEMDRVHKYHLTLQFWPELCHERLTYLRHGLSNFNHEPFTLPLDKVVAMPSTKRPYLYSLMSSTPQGIVAFRNALIEDVVGVEFTKGFHPHVTLARNARIRTPKSHDLVAMIKSVPVRVDNVTLYISDPAQGLESYIPDMSIQF